MNRQLNGKRGIPGCGLSQEEVMIGNVLSTEYESKYIEVGSVETRKISYGRTRTLVEETKKLVARNKRSVNYGVDKKVNDEGLVGSEASCPSDIMVVKVVNQPKGNPCNRPEDGCCS